ncbi:MAG: rRNA (cytidine1402-2-O)-methyltransferase [Bacteroidota bacterium]|nr:rRNA (cytidine1402-2-O)-methyltransferase [Bacteroidota bacterium]
MKKVLDEIKKNNSELGKLYIVATPIGNLSDMTFRAVEILKSVDTVLCEDTRTTKKLLDHYDITARTMSFHSHSKLSQVDKIINMLIEGNNLALVSDAGTPCISDPGVMLIAEIRKAIPEVTISPIPGASALVSALSVSGIPVHEFTFKGFVPHKKGRETFFSDIASMSHTVVFYESVHRFIKTLESLEKSVPYRNIVVGRELTKMFEEIISGTPSELKQYFDKNPDHVRGEFVVVVDSKTL